MIKDLEGFFDSRLKFITHLNYVVSNSLAKLAFVRRHSSHFTHPCTLKILLICSAFFRPKLDYAVFIWQPYHAGHINRVERSSKNVCAFRTTSIQFLISETIIRSRCRLISLFPLSDSGTIQAVAFIFDLVNGAIDCPALLERIQLNLPFRKVL